YKLLAVVAFFHITAWTWVFFRAQSLSEAWMMTRRMLHVDVTALLTQPLTLVAAGLYALHIFEHWIRNREDAASRVWHWVPFPLRGAVYAGLILVMFYFMKGETYDFIYFQF